MTTAPTNQCNVYVVQEGDTLSEIGEWFHVPWRELQRINHIQNPDLIHPGDRLLLSEDHNVCTVYTVVRGDTLSEIGEKFHVDWRPLARYNHIRNPDHIEVGQKICIPQS
ncbi:LysM peptidoglycan-binding domain-containing protein [Saccharopolyspora phatthalungensis]|uniref:Putative chitinase n=1 Tax=Saccharopolyspora phatthalungensis TaxID=664693 RepID=A0A840QJ05_9PSEU|nr:LysM peptidoglycan-binding domain-containing protein [Saccharopolyspora phatthalungensis]MBB5158685.1 putative chitinase [Saccharopolyspora phatthalungensis]